MALSMVTGCAKTADNSGNNANNQATPSQEPGNADEGSGKISRKERVLKVMFGEHPNQPVKNLPAQQEIFKKTI